MLVSWKRALPEGGAASLSCPIDNFYVEYWLVEIRQTKGENRRRCYILIVFVDQAPWAAWHPPDAHHPLPLYDGGGGRDSRGQGQGVQRDRGEDLQLPGGGSQGLPHFRDGRSQVCRSPKLSKMLKGNHCCCIHRFTVSKAPSRAALDSIAIVATLLLSSCFLTRLAE